MWKLTVFVSSRKRMATEVSLVQCVVPLVWHPPVADVERRSRARERPQGERPAVLVALGLYGLEDERSSLAPDSDLPSGDAECPG